MPMTDEELAAVYFFLLRNARPKARPAEKRVVSVYRPNKIRVDVIGVGKLNERVKKLFAGDYKRSGPSEWTKGVVTLTVVNSKWKFVFLENQDNVWTIMSSVERDYVGDVTVGGKWNVRHVSDGNSSVEEFSDMIAMSVDPVPLEFHERLQSFTVSCDNYRGTNETRKSWVQWLKTNLNGKYEAKAGEWVNKDTTKCSYDKETKLWKFKFGSGNITAYSQGDLITNTATATGNIGWKVMADGKELSFIFQFSFTDVNLDLPVKVSPPSGVSSRPHKERIQQVKKSYADNLVSFEVKVDSANQDIVNLFTGVYSRSIFVTDMWSNEEIGSCLIYDKNKWRFVHRSADKTVVYLEIGEGHDSSLGNITFATCEITKNGVSTTERSVFTIFNHVIRGLLYSFKLNIEVENDRVPENIKEAISNMVNVVYTRENDDSYTSSDGTIHIVKSPNFWDFELQANIDNTDMIIDVSFSNCLHFEDISSYCTINITGLNRENLYEEFRNVVNIENAKYDSPT